MDVPDWLIDFLDGISLWDAIAFALFIGAIIWFVTKKGWRGIMTFARAILATANVIDNVKVLPDFSEKTTQALEHITKVLDDHTVTLDEHMAQIKEIYHETHKNNGSSIKDAVDRTEEAASRLEESVEGIHGRLDSLESTVTGLDASVTGLKKEDEELWAALDDTQNPFDQGEDS